MYLTVEDAKRHLNIDATFTDDDGYISDLIDVAEDAVQPVSYTHLTLPTN